MNKPLTASLLSVVLAAACATTETDNSAIRTQLAATESRLDSLQRVVAVIELQRSREQTLKSWDEVAYLTPGDDGYSVVRTSVGSLTVALVDIQPYASGSRVRLKFGNTTSATITGLKATIEWGRVDRGVPDNESAQSREFTATNPLPGGSWTTLPVILENVPPGQLGFVRIRDVNHQGIQLLVR